MNEGKLEMGYLEIIVDETGKQVGAREETTKL